MIKSFKLRGNIVTEELEEQEKSSPLAIYYNQEMADIPGGILQKLNQGPLDPAIMMKYEDKNKLFDEGYLEDEIGYGLFSDGSGYASMLTQMPGVTGDMIDWWFSWHPLENLRYKIWFPTAHYSVSADDSARLSNKNLPFKKRYQEMRQYPVENIGGIIEELVINFKDPANVGFDMTRMKQSKVPTIIVGEIGMPSPEIYHTHMIHFVRENDNGVELRSRFWIMADFKPTHAKDKALAQKLYLEIGKNKKAILERAHNMAQHDVAEYHNLAKILPTLYKQYAK